VRWRTSRTGLGWWIQCEPEVPRRIARAIGGPISFARSLSSPTNGLYVGPIVSNDSARPERTLQVWRCFGRKGTGVWRRVRCRRPEHLRQDDLGRGYRMDPQPELRAARQRPRWSELDMVDSKLVMMLVSPPRDDSQPHLMTGAVVRFVGGMNFPSRASRVSWWRDASWPLAELLIGDRTVRVQLRGSQWRAPSISGERERGRLQNSIVLEVFVSVDDAASRTHGRALGVCRQGLAGCLVASSRPPRSPSACNSASVNVGLDRRCEAMWPTLVCRP
jgi:hypothetical protein